VLVEAVIANADTAPISDSEKVLFAFIRQLNRASWQLTRTDIETLVQKGWSEEAVYDAVSVCALFNFYNRWCDGAGVHVMAPEHHAMGGKRMAAGGYTARRPEPPAPDGRG
jgi:hypothetical protein